MLTKTAAAIGNISSLKFISMKDINREQWTVLPLTCSYKPMA